LNAGVNSSSRRIRRVCFDVMIGAYPPIAAPALTILAAMTQNVAEID